MFTERAQNDRSEAESAGTSEVRPAASRPANFRLWLRLHRKRLGLTQQELAERLRAAEPDLPGLSHGTVNTWETAEGRVPSLGQFVVLMRVLEVSQADAFEGLHLAHDALLRHKAAIRESA